MICNLSLGRLKLQPDSKTRGVTAALLFCVRGSTEESWQYKKDYPQPRRRCYRAFRARWKHYPLPDFGSTLHIRSFFCLVDSGTANELHHAGTSCNAVLHAASSNISPLHCNGELWRANAETNVVVFRPLGPKSPKTTLNPGAQIAKSRFQSLWAKQFQREVKRNRSNPNYPRPFVSEVASQTKVEGSWLSKLFPYI